MALRFASSLLILALPLLAAGQASSPIIIFGEDSPPPASAQPTTPVPGAGMPGFADNAVTRLGENTTGHHLDAPVAPSAPPAPSSPVAPAAPAPAVVPPAPAAPPSPANRLWPRNSIELFLPPCTGLRPQYVMPCTCVITTLMLQMPHDEFLKKSEDGTIEQDPLLQKIRTECATTPAKKE